MAVTRLADLPPHQRRVVVLVASRGLSNKEIASELGIATGTVRQVLTAIYQRLGITARPALVMWAWRQPGWQEIDAAALAAGQER